MPKRIVIIDGNSLINRAYYAMQRPMITRRGMYTQGIYGFLNMLNKIEYDYSPDYIAVAWDRAAPTFRHLEYDEYKAGRRRMPPELAMQIPVVKDIISAMRISSFEIDGYEADDIIGTLARTAEEKGLEPLIITGDKDALQLATDVTHILITRKGISDFDLYDKNRMIERYHLTPSQFIDLKGLMGDQSDNIPGIPGIGEKTGIKLLEQFGSVSNLLAHTDEIANEKLRTKVEQNAQLAAISRRLAEINTHVPIDFDIEDMRLTEPDTDRLIDLYTELEFNSFLKKMHVEPKNDEQSDTNKIHMTDMRIISSEEELCILDNIEEGSPVTIKVFSDDSHVAPVRIFAIALLHSGTYIFISGEDELIKKAVAVLDAKKLHYSGHELVRDYFALFSYGLKNIVTEWDTSVAGYLLDPSRSDYTLKAMMLESFHEEIMSEKEFAAVIMQTDLLGNSDRLMSEYGMTTLVSAARLEASQRTAIKKGNLMRVLTEAELPLIEVLASMETSGFRVNRTTLEAFGRELRSQIGRITDEIYEYAGEKFNINSTLQLGEILFEKLSLPAEKKTKRGYSTSAEILEKLRDRHPIIDRILTYRMLTKLNSTYVEGLMPLISGDGRIRAHFRQTVTATGRISCQEPNLQNIPIRNEYGRLLRKAFIPSEGCILTGADYSQIELRVLAHLSGDKSLIEAFRTGADIHRTTAARVFGLAYDDVTPLDRSRAKAVNFGVIYGMSGFGLADELHISRRDAERYIKDYFDKHQAVKEYMDEQVEAAKQLGFTTTVLGRRRYINEIHSPNRMTRNLGERLAMNSPIQGSAADIIKIAMIRVYNELKERGLKAKLILQVHDELIIDTPLDEKDIVSELLTRNMSEAMQLKVELKSDLNAGKTWYDLK